MTMPGRVHGKNALLDLGGPLLRPEALSKIESRLDFEMKAYDCTAMGSAEVLPMLKPHSFGADTESSNSPARAGKRLKFHMRRFLA